MEEIMSDISPRIDRLHIRALLCLGLLAAGCQPKPRPVMAPKPSAAAIDYAQPLRLGEVALRKIDSTQYPDFSRVLATANLADLRRSVQNSLIYFARPGSNARYPYLDIDHARAAATLRAFVELIDTGVFALPASQFNQRIAERFDIYQSVGASIAGGSRLHESGSVHRLFHADL